MLRPERANCGTAEMTTFAEPHGYITKGIHWVSAGVIAFGYFKGLDDVSQLADPSTFRTEVLFAIALGLLFFVRLFWTKRISGATRLPRNAPGWERVTSKAVHLGLYLTVFGIVLSGLGIALGYATPVLSGIFLTSMIGLHEVTLTILPLLLIVHVVGALWHRFIRRDGVFQSMAF